MRIGMNLFDLYSPGSRGEGVLNYARGLLSGLAEIDEVNDYYLFVNPLGESTFPMVPAKTHWCVVPWDPNRRINRLVFEQVFLPWWVRYHRLDFVHFPTGSASWFMLDKSVVTHHAANYTYYKGAFPEASFGPKQWFLYFVEKYLLRRVRTVITVSEFSRQDLIARCHVRPEKVTVVYHASPLLH